MLPAGTNQYDMSLFTLVVMDGFGTGLPVGHIIASSESEEHLRPCFEILKNRCPNFKPEGIVMTDCALNAFNAIHDVWPGMTHWLCAFHVDKAWREAIRLRTLAHGAEKKRIVDSIYSQMDVIRKCTTEASFHRGWAKFKEIWSQSQSEVVGYFSKNWFTGPSKKFNPLKWAYCYRQQSPAVVHNTNNFTESWHRAFKDSRRFGGRAGKRMDVLLSALLDNTRGMQQRAIRRVAMGEKPAYPPGAKDDFKKGNNIRADHITLVGEEQEWTWSVKSQDITRSHMFYTVKFLPRPDPHCTCEAVVCCHRWRCTCGRYSSVHGGRVCKHICATERYWGTKLPRQPCAPAVDHGLAAANRRAVAVRGMEAVVAQCRAALSAAEQCLMRLNGDAAPEGARVEAAAATSERARRSLAVVVTDLHRAQDAPQAPTPHTTVRQVVLAVPREKQLYFKSLKAAPRASSATVK